MKYKIVFLALYFLLYCSNSKKVETEDSNDRNVSIPQSPDISLEISAAHIKYFQNTNSTTYKDSNLNSFFDDLKKRSDEACRVVWSRTKYDKKILYNLIKEENFKNMPFKNLMNEPIPKLIAGCWNFFKMNDMNSDRDFLLVKSLYPNVKKDCYSVGFLQPYLMHNILDCSTIHPIDVDWRILDAHKQMIQKFYKGEFKEQEQLETTLKGLDIGWIARFDGKPLLERADVDLNTICFKSNHEMCKGFLYGFQKKYKQDLPIRLHLSYLHEGSFAVGKDSVPVIYLSNAIDDVYTSWKEFNQLIKSVGDNLSENGYAIFIYHSAGRDRFGIYQLSKTSNGNEISTICRDEYISPPVQKQLTKYTTYFERVSVTKKKPEDCSIKFKSLPQ